jgi:hypothetical protein
MAAEKTTGGYRERVYFTDGAWGRIEVMADRMGLDERTFIRMCVGLQLAQFEASLGAAQSARVRLAVQQDVTEKSATFFEKEGPPVPSVAVQKRMVEQS